MNFFMETSPKVEIISYTQNPEGVVAAAIRQCYSKSNACDLKEKTDEATRLRLIQQVVKSGHFSTIEHASFTFAIEGVSRALTHQLVRHRHASFSQQSQRYVRAEDFDYVIPPKVKIKKAAKEIYEKQISEAAAAYKKLVGLGIDKEDARFLLPNAAETKIVVTMNARELLHFFELRLCNRAQWEIRVLAYKMLQAVKPLAPNIFKYAGPTCETEKICWEGKLACPKWKVVGAKVRERG
jgi:thymidylate synthase (FAD)